jgi:hypothetical protein
MKRKILSAVLGILLGLTFLGCDPPTEAETTGSIEGIIYDASTSQQLGGVTVTTEPITSSKITDTNGGFLIDGVEPETYTLQAVKSGFNTNSTTVNVIAGETASADLQLTAILPELSVAVSSLDFGSTSTSLPFTISNTGEGTLEWSVSENADWISVNPANGSISDAQASVAVSVDRAGMNPGDYSESITVSSNAGSAVVQINMTVEGPVLVLSNNSLNFGTVSDNLSFIVTNGGIGTITYNVVYTAAWLTVNPTSGSATTETDVMTVSVDRAGLAYGNYFETITVTSNANSATIDVMMIIADPSNPQLSAYPSTIDFGTNSTEETFSVSNSGSGMLTWNITDDKSWISVDPHSGTTETETDEITVNIDRLGQSPGTHTGVITISSDGGNQNISVSMTIPDEPSLSVAPTSLDFGSTETGMSFSVVNAGSGNLEWSVSDNQEWITTSPGSGTNYGTVNVNISRDGMTVGDYSGTVTVSSNGGSGYVEVYVNMPEDEPPEEIILNDPTVMTINSIALSWDMSVDSDFGSYLLYRSTSPGVSESSNLLTQIVNRYTLDYNDEDLPDATTYYYRIYVEDEAGQTTGSNTVSASTMNAPGTWGAFATVPTDLNGVSALTDDFAYVVGDSGKIYKWDGASLLQQDSPTTEDLYGIAVIETDDIWLSGVEGVWHNTGGFWIQEAGYPTSECRGMDFVSSDSIWVEGDSEIYFYNGAGWTTISIGLSWVEDISMKDADLGWAITNGGGIYKFNGISWNHLANIGLSPNGGYAKAIWGFDSEQYWIGGYDILVNGAYDRSIAFWDGTGWVDMYDMNYYASSYYARINDIDGLNEIDVWFVGGGLLRKLFHWNGTELLDILNPSPISPQVNMITFIDANSGWGVCDDGVILRYSP